MADILARTAYETKRKGATISIVLIVLGSVVATQGGIEKVDLLPHSAGIFLIIGVVIAALRSEPGCSRVQNTATLASTTLLSASISAAGLLVVAPSAVAVFANVGGRIA
jgi:hypothetical protein